jgi:hypothetical protein
VKTSSKYCTTVQYLAPLRYATLLTTITICIQKNPHVQISKPALTFFPRKNAEVGLTTNVHAKCYRAQHIALSFLCSPALRASKGGCSLSVRVQLTIAKTKKKING